MLLVLFAVVVFAVLVWALVDSVRGQETGAGRLGVLFAVFAGGAYGAGTADGASTAIRVVLYAVGAGLFALMVYARVRAARRRTA